MGGQTEADVEGWLEELAQTVIQAREPERFAPWLLAIARHQALDHLRRRRGPPGHGFKDGGRKQRPRIGGNLVIGHEDQVHPVVA